MFSKVQGEKLINPLNANLRKWSNTIKQFVGNLPTNCLSVFDHSVGLALKRLINTYIIKVNLIAVMTSSLNLTSNVDVECFFVKPDFVDSWFSIKFNSLFRN